MITQNIDWIFDNNFYIKNGKWTYNKNANKIHVKQFKRYFKHEKEKKKMLKNCLQIHKYGL